MHSRVIQISESPISEDSYIHSDSYPVDHWFLNNIADYVAPDDDRTGTLKWLKECLSNNNAPISFFCQEGGKGFELQAGFHTAYFSSRYDAFREELDSFVKELTLETYSDGTLDYPMFLIETAYKDEYDIYVDIGDDQILPLDTFLRTAKVGVRYYFGGTLDYHF